MKKRKAFRQLSRTSSHKWAMLRNMVTSLIKYERIQTTLPKAKELRHVADKMITHAKKGDLHNRRLAARVIREKPVLTKLFEILGARYADREGGYTRVMKLAKPRMGDKAPMAIIEYVDRPGEIRAARPPAKRKAQNLADVLREVGIVPVGTINDSDTNTRIE